VMAEGTLKGFAALANPFRGFNEIPELPCPRVAKSSTLDWNSQTPSV